jgi:DNA polymerase III delta prime subunit
MIDVPKYDPLVPKKVEDLIGNNELWTNLKKQICDGTSSHIVLDGPPGCGKSLFLRLALSGFLTLRIDCTANSGLRDVRDMLHNFARGSRSMDGKHRWIILERADSLIADTQAFLRRMLETTSGSTRVVFECRDGGALTEPILSRCTLYHANAPLDTEISYEIQRRTEFTLPSTQIPSLCALSFGNVRLAIQNALAARWCSAAATAAGTATSTSIVAHEHIHELLKKRPTRIEDEKEWMLWAIEAETVCRNNGIDLRDVLRLGWKLHPIVNNICNTWSRLGGTSSRTLFFDAVHALRSV